MFRYACGSTLAGVAKADITDREAKPVNDPLYVKALVLRDDGTKAVIITLDAVAIGELGRIGNDFIGNVRLQLQKKLDIPPSNVLIHASHCHGIVRTDTAQRTVQAVEEAWRNMVPVNIGAGIGHEDRIMENRRLKLKDGADADVRRAYSLPPDEAVAAIGPVDPQIGLLRLDRRTAESGSRLQLRLPSHPRCSQRRKLGRLSRLCVQGDRREFGRRYDRPVHPGMCRRRQSGHVQECPQPHDASRWGTCSGSAPCGH